MLVVEPFCAGSHRQLAEALLSEVLPPGAAVVSLPGRKWHWRMYASALHFARAIPVGPPPDLLFCSSMTRLSDLLALRPDLAAARRKVLYFHETQLAYPRRKREEKDFAFGMAEVMSALVADVVAFNSAFCRDSFLDHVDPLMRQIPEAGMRVLGLATEIRAKSVVLHFPVAVPPPLQPRVGDGSPLRVLWNHRWEHDKGPEAFFAALAELAATGERFEVIVLGERFPEAPPVFAASEEALRAAGHVRHWGFAPSRAEYEELLQVADVVVSTALHEFFGVAVLEAALRGCYPLVPDRLAYPELYPPEHRYRTDRQLFKRLREMCRAPDRLRASAYAWSEQLDLHRFTWPRMREAFEEVLCRPSTPSTPSTPGDPGDPGDPGERGKRVRTE